MLDSFKEDLRQKNKRKREAEAHDTRRSPISKLGSAQSVQSTPVHIYRTRSQTLALNQDPPRLGDAPPKAPAESDIEALFISSLISKGETLYFPLYLHKSIEDLFDQLDSKNSQLLTSDSFSDRIPCLHQNKQRLWQSILKCGVDFNGDGSISITEFKKFFIYTALQLESGHIHNTSSFGSWDKICKSKTKEFTKRNSDIKRLSQLETVGQTMEGLHDRLFCYVALLIDNFRDICGNLETSELQTLERTWSN